MKLRNSRPFGKLPAIHLVVTAVLAGAGASCSSDNGTVDPAVPANIAIVSGQQQEGAVGTALPSPMVVRVTSSNGGAVSNATVEWTVVRGGGTLGGSSSTTNSQGQAQMTLTLGAAAGPNEVRATVAGYSNLTQTFTHTAIAPLPADPTPASIEIASGDQQTGNIGAALANPFFARVRNAGGENLPGITVAWTVTSGGGSLESPSSQTNAQGLASNTLTLGPSAGVNTVTAAVQANAALNVVFTATGQTPPPGGSVSVRDDFFDPANVSVRVGATVTWTWAGSNLHNVVWVGGGFNDGPAQTSGTHQVTFGSTGAFDYYCAYHGTATTGMRGSVTVTQ